MKKIVSIILCVVMCLLALASCAEKPIGSYRDQYNYEEEVVEEITLNLYIICDDSTADNAKTTIGREVKEYTKSKFNTLLNVHYVSESEYAATVAEKTKANATDMANIVLINSKQLMDSLVASSSVADLTDFYKKDAFGKLNVTIASDILEASKIDGKLYCVPNNHVVGDYDNDGVIANSGYKYLVIDEAVARFNRFGDVATLSSYDTVEKFMAEGALGKKLSCLTYDASNGTLSCSHSDNKCVEIVDGGYAAQKTFVDSGKYFTVLEKPSCTAEDAFSSAFAIINDPSKINNKEQHDNYVSRVMEIIYALNTDSTFRNLLQYGVKGTNYNVVDGNIVRFNSTDNPDDVYHMNLLYTGNIFLAEYCSELGWTAEVSGNGNLQNKKTVISQDVYQP